MADKQICQQTGRRIFKRHQDAAAAVARIQRVTRGHLAECPQSFYQCDHCRRWHVTSYSAEQTRTIQHHRREKAKKGNKPRRRTP